jgi:linoleoyl-CoA desaturase
MQNNHQQRTRFIEALYEKADYYFAARPWSKYASPFYWIKTLVFIFLYVAAYYYFLFESTGFTGLVWAAVVLGLCHVLIPVNIAHDAIHNSLSRHTWINRLGCYGLEITGANSYMYGKKHLEAHFNKENGHKVNSIELQGLLLRKKEKTATVNLPYVYYLFYSQYMIFIRDFLLFFQSPHKIPMKEWLKLYLSKIAYTAAFLVLPFMLIPVRWWQVLIALLLMYLIVTVLLVVILLMPTEKMQHSKMNDQNSYNEKWVMEILKHNVDFTPGSLMLNYLVGGANLNVVHYFFPSVNHIHYNRLAVFVEETASEYRLPYRKQSVKDVLAIHLRYLKNIDQTGAELPATTNNTLQ